MSIEFEKKLSLVSGYKDYRYALASEIISDGELFDKLIWYSFNATDKIATKAIWVLELVCNEKVTLIQVHLNTFCDFIEKLDNESSIRSASKICMLVTASYFRSNEIQLTQIHRQKITETCLDWLIGKTKVASKCYSIRALYFLGKEFNWVHEELKIILEKDYNNHSAAYQAVAKEILRKIK